MYEWFQMSSHVCNFHKTANQLEIAKSLSFCKAPLQAELCWETWEIHLDFLLHLPHPVHFFSRRLLQGFNQSNSPLYVNVKSTLTVASDQCWSKHIQNLERDILRELLRNKTFNIKFFLCSFHFIFLTADLSGQHRSCLPEGFCRTCQYVLRENSALECTLPALWYGYNSWALVFMIAVINLLFL